MDDRDLRGAAAPADEASGCLARVVWMFAGNLLLAMLAMTIASLPPWTFSWRDAAFVGVVGAALAARVVDVRRLDGRTAKGAPATEGHLRRFVALYSGVALAAWVAVQSTQV